MHRVQEREDLAHDLTAPWVLPTGPSSVTLARRAARQQMTDFGITDAELIDTVELLVSELTGNVVKHAGGRASLQMRRIGDVLRIEVCDANPTRVPVERNTEADAVSGRGLMLVSALATSWGYDQETAQKCTWVELDLSGATSSSPR
jgi:anti-sigma regulatory factor (Ser/Thr protein kinase)